LNKYLESILPPLLLNKMKYLNSYIHFVRYKEFLAKNITLKNLHNGKRCFLLGSGPSILNENLKPLKNEIVFALNNFCVHDDFEEIMSGNEPKYYITAPIHPPQTQDEWSRWFFDMEKRIPITTTLLLGLDKYPFNTKYITDKYKIFQKHKMYWYFSGIFISKDYIFSKSDIQLQKLIWAASSVSTYAILTAIYMGFDEIYLLGVDHNYICISNEKEYRFYKNSIHQKDEINRMKLKRSDEIFGAANVFLENELIAENTEAKIFNCSEASLLNMFEKKSFLEVLKAKK